jgi:hypothetical protein
LKIGKIQNELLGLLVEIDGEEKLGYLNKEGNWAIAPGIIPYDGSDDLPSVLAGFIHVFTGERHLFFDHKGKIIREDSMEADWEMMTVLQDGNAGFWAPN